MSSTRAQVVNDFSTTWFDTFLSLGTAAPVHRELNFIQRHLPLADFPRILDVPCGIGRHAGPLAALGHEVLGIDRDPAAIKVARSSSPEGAAYEVRDIAELEALPGLFDGVLCLWQSFGYGSEAENRETLAAMTHRLRPKGRLLLDVYNADALAALPGEATDIRGSRSVYTRRTLADRRFRVELRYSDSPDNDTHDWLVYTPGELAETAATVGLRPLFTCAWFDEQTPASATHQRMQLLFERR